MLKTKEHQEGGTLMYLKLVYIKSVDIFFNLGLKEMWNAYTSESRIV